MMVGVPVYSSLHLEQPSQVLRDLVGTYLGTCCIKAPCWERLGWVWSS